MSTFRQYRWLWIFVAAVVCLLGVWLALPFIVSRVGESYLKRQGVEDVRLNVQSVGTHNASALRSRAATQDWELDVDLLQVEYRISVLWKQRLRKLNVDGARLVFKVPEQKLPEVTMEPEHPAVVWTDPDRHWEGIGDPEDPMKEPDPDRPPVTFEPGPFAVDVDPERGLFPRADPFALLYQLPVRELQLSRSEVALKHAGGISPAVAVDLSLRPAGNESHWRMDFGTPGLTSQLDLQVEPARERVRLSGAVDLRERSAFADWERWLNAQDDWMHRLPKELDWSQLQLQFLNEWRAGRMQMLSLQAELRDLSWRSDAGTEWGGSNHAVATWTIEDDRSVLFFGAGIEGFAWQDFSFGDGYAEGQLQFNTEQARLQWAPIELRYQDRLLGEFGGELDAALERGLQANARLLWHTAGPVSESVPLRLEGYRDLRDAAVIRLQVGDASAAAEFDFDSDWQRLSAYRGHGHLKARLGPGLIQWVPLDWELPEAALGWHSGEVRVEGDWDTRGFLPRGRGEVVLDNLGWTKPGGEIELRNFRGTIPFRFLGPPQVLGRPELRADSLTVAGLEMRDLRLRFRLPALDALEVETLTAEAAGGQVVVRPFRVDLRDPTVDTVIEFNNFEAREIQALLPEVGYALEGRLNGRLPLRYRNGEWSLGEGYLRLDSATGGTFRFTDEAFLRDTVPLDVERLDIGERFYEALMQGVTLTHLEVHLFDPEQPDVPLYLSLSGEARTERLVVPIEGLVIRNRIDPADLRELMDMLGLGWLRW